MRIYALACATGLLVVLVSIRVFGAEAVGKSGFSRIAIRGGRFVETATGKPFTPLGVNYFRLGKLKDGKVSHATFCPGFYDRGFIEKMMADVASRGFNTVRTFQVFVVCEDGILTSSKAREISPEYLANMVHFLQQAAKNNVHVIFTWDVWNPGSEWWSSEALPNDAEYAFRPTRDPNMGVNGSRLVLSEVRTRANSITSLIEALRKKDPELLPVVLAWELENEVYFVANQAPFKSRQGVYSFAGKDYDLASDEQTQALMDDVITQWANACADAIHRADPEALVGTGVFTFAAVKRGGPGTLSKDTTKDNRVPARPLALLRSRMDYADLHLYAYRSDKVSVAESLAHSLASVEWEKLQQEARRAGKPIMVGESGICSRYLQKSPDGPIDHQLGVECLRQHMQGIRERGFAGALYWDYGNPESGPNDQYPSMVLFSQYARVLRDVWAGPK